MNSFCDHLGPFGIPHLIWGRFWSNRCLALMHSNYIFKEIHTDTGIAPASHGDLSSWAHQGVLLLNAILTVEHKKPASHRKWGWQEFTDHCIQTISNELEHVVFMLWGNFAQTKAALIDKDRHLVLTAKHPSPLARGAFFGCKHFSKANTYLKEHGKKEINWSLPSNQLF